MEQSFQQKSQYIQVAHTFSSRRVRRKNSWWYFRYQLLLHRASESCQSSQLTQKRTSEIHNPSQQLLQWLCVCIQLLNPGIVHNVFCFGSTIELGHHSYSHTPAGPKKQVVKTLINVGKIVPTWGSLPQNHRSMYSALWLVSFPNLCLKENFYILQCRSKYIILFILGLRDSMPRFYLKYDYGCIDTSNMCFIITSQPTEF